VKAKVPNTRLSASITQAAGTIEASVNGVATKPDPVVAQAKRDIDAGLVDTDMRATAGLDAKRRAKLVPGAAGKPLKSAD
jgi:hypothetical protein